MDVEKEILDIRARNIRVEQDKAWEVSAARRIFIVVITYITASVWLIVINDSVPLLKALVPVAGYVLSTLSLPPLKKWWINRARI